MLDLAGIPLLAKDRGPDDPIVIAGGPAVFNIEPVADFLDGVLLGDGEEAIHEIVECAKRIRGKSREEKWAELAKIDGVYVPAHWQFTFGDDGKITSGVNTHNPAQTVVKKRV